MADYIKKQDVIVYFLKQADAAYQEFEIYGGEAGIEAETLHSVADELVDFPTAEVAPVRHGRWVTHYRSGTTVAEGYVSTCCDMWNNRKSDFCPNCGARMDGAE